MLRSTTTVPTTGPERSAELVIIVRASQLAQKMFLGAPSFIPVRVVASRHRVHPTANSLLTYKTTLVFNRQINAMRPRRVPVGVIGGTIAHISGVTPIVV
jgi:hypothetical protein